MRILPSLAAMWAGIVIGVPGADESLIGRCRYPARPDSTWVLPKELREVSGLAEWQGSLLAHDDEMGRLFAINPRTGRARPWLVLQGLPRDDFEGIAVIGSTAWLMTSAARLYAFPAAASTTPVPFRLVDTKLGTHCEFEGLAVDSGPVLLLPCKVLEKGQSGIVIHRWDASRGMPAAPATITIAGSAVRKAGFKAFHPSAIERDAATRHLLVLSARPAGLVELDRAGTIVGAISLQGHPQAEGISLTRRNDLLIADEGGGRSGTLSRHVCAS